MITSLISPQFFQGHDCNSQKSQGDGEGEGWALCSGHICSQPLVQLPSAPTGGWELLPGRQRFPHPAEKGQQGCSSAPSKRDGKGREKEDIAWGLFCWWNYQAVFSTWGKRRVVFFQLPRKFTLPRYRSLKKILRERIELGGHGRGTEGLFLPWDKAEKSRGRRNVVEHPAGSRSLCALQPSSSCSTLTQACTSILTLWSEPKRHTNTCPGVICSLLQVIWTYTSLF